MRHSNPQVDEIEKGSIDGALAVARDLHPGAVCDRLFARHEFAQAGTERIAEFIARWFVELPSPYLQAAAADIFAARYADQLRSVDDAPTIGAHMLLVARQRMLRHFVSTTLDDSFTALRIDQGGVVPSEIVASWQRLAVTIDTSPTQTRFS